MDGSMLEVSHAGGEQGNIVFVAAVNGVLVTDRAPRVGYHSHASLTSCFH